MDEWLDGWMDANQEAISAQLRPCRQLSAIRLMGVGGGAAIVDIEGDIELDTMSPIPMITIFQCPTLSNRRSNALQLIDFMQIIDNEYITRL